MPARGAAKGSDSKVKKTSKKASTPKLSENGKKAVVESILDSIEIDETTDSSATILTTPPKHSREASIARNNNPRAPKSKTPKSKKSKTPTTPKGTPSSGSSKRSPGSKTPWYRKKSASKSPIPLRNYMSDDSIDEPPSPKKISQLERRALGIGFNFDGEDHADPTDPAFQGWTDAELDLYNRFAARGASTLLPSKWKLDFPTMPDELFEDDEVRAYINSLSDNNFKAIKALNNLLGVGTRVRDRMLAGVDPAATLTRALNTYLNWCIIDGELSDKNFIQVYAHVSPQDNETTEDMVDRLNTRFHEMAKEYRDLFAQSKSRQAQRRSRKSSSPSELEDLEPPTLYGAIVARSVVAVVTYDSASPETAKARTVAVFDFADDTQDVWNGFAIAILLITVRNYLAGLDYHSLPPRRNSDPDS